MRAPNPRRVRIFLAEKGLTVPMQELDLSAGETLTPAFLAKNPYAAVPVLELDDGTCLAESIAICRYFEGVQPEPPLMGRDARDAALVEMWNLRMELYLMRAVEECFRHTHEYYRTRVQQIPAYGELCRSDILKEYAGLDTRLAATPYVAGDHFTIADITALCAIDFARVVKVRIAPELRHLQRWHATVSARPSAAA